MERDFQSDSKNLSPMPSNLVPKPNETTAPKFMGFGLTTGNFTSISVSNEALERAKRLFDSPETPSQQLKAQENVGLRIGANALCELSAGALSRAQKMFESPSQTSIQLREDKSTDEVDKKSPRKSIPVAVRAGIIRQNRGELACGNSFHPKFISLNNPRPQQIPLPKRRTESPDPKPKQKFDKPTKKSSVTLLDLNSHRPLRGFYNSFGLLVNADNAGYFVFYCNCYTGGCQCSRDGMSWEDFYDQMVDYGLKVSKEWVQHHYRLIVWKYASYERRIAGLKGIFSVEKVLENLKHRYEKQCMQNKRSILQKIIEGDDLPSKRMVLCVGSIKTFGSSFCVELLDGWYAIWTDINSESLFFPLYQRKTIAQGMKIEMVGCCIKDGKLIIPYNSARRAAWDRKLGEVNTVFPFPICISSIKENGGMIGRVTGYVSRIYPLLYIENNTIKSKFTVNDTNSSFFECLIKDGLVDFTKKKTSSALIRFKSSANEIYENLKLGALVNLYFLQPGEPKNFKRILIFNHKSKILYGKKERKDVVKIRKLVHNKTKCMKEVDAVGIVTNVQRTQGNEIKSLNLACAHGNIRVAIHNPSFFGRVLNMVEVSNLKYMKILAFLNVVADSKKGPVGELKTTNYTEIVHTNFPSHMMQQILVLKEFNLNSVLSHRPECDHFGCVCALDS